MAPVEHSIWCSRTVCARSFQKRFKSYSEASEKLVSEKNAASNYAAAAGAAAAMSSVAAATGPLALILQEDEAKAATDSTIGSAREIAAD